MGGNPPHGAHKYPRLWNRACSAHPTSKHFNDPYWMEQLKVHVPATQHAREENSVTSTVGTTGLTCALTESVLTSWAGLAFYLNSFYYMPF